MHVVATAGHVDHGKSTLIRALTGMEPDRWAEEQRRGMTIDLGYAWTTLPGDEVVAFVDVPGHERFVTNMLAGVGPVPAVLFVVAADEGWGAQSAEHLAALDALQVQHGVLAVTRSDLGDAELAEAEAREHLAATSLAQIESVIVSAVTGDGLPQLRTALGRMTQRLARPVESRVRLWVDRVFTVRGAGTVVTGTLSSGRVRLGDQLQVHRSGEPVRVRGVETLKQQVSEATAVARVALNLRGVKATQVQRGDALVASGEWLDATVLDVRLHGAAELSSELTLHLGSAGVPVHVRPLGADVARLSLARPLPVAIGERAVLRDPGVRHVVAAATVLDPLPPPLRRRGAARQRGRELSEVSGEPDLRGEVRRRGLVRWHDLNRAGVPVDVDDLPREVRRSGDWLVDVGTWQHWRDELLDLVDEWAQAHPLRPELPPPAAVARLGLPSGAILADLVQVEPVLVLDEHGVGRRTRQPALPPAAEQALERLLTRLADEPFAAPDAPDLAAAGLTDQYLAVAVRENRLVRVAPGVFLRPPAIDEAVRRLADVAQPFTVAQARAALATTRRVAVPLLELLDERGHTERVDAQHRRLRSSAATTRAV